MNKSSNTELSIVIPVYNECKVITELYQRLKRTLSGETENHEIVFINDGSMDNTGIVLSEIAESDKKVKVVTLSRNFGHQPALAAGIDHSSGRAVILMDGDLQDRPEAIPLFLKKWRDGHDVVYAVRASRKESPAMRAIFKLFYKIIQKMSGIRQPLDAGIFGLLDRKVVGVLQAMPERNRYFPGLRAYAGFRQAGIPVDRDARYSRETRVGFSGLVKLACDGIFSFSYMPIRIITVTGLVMAFFSFAYVFRILYKKLVSGEAILGWASTLTAILLIGGLQLVMLGLLGEYIGRIYDETKKRPYYIVSSRLNFDCVSCGEIADE